MKTREQIQAEEIGYVYTLDEFIDLIDEGFINSHDGYGFFHDGEKRTQLEVYDPSLTWEDVKDFPYVVWINN